MVESLEALALAGVRILLVDDDGDSCLLFAEVLAAAGAEVEAVRSGHEVFPLIETGHFDVLVADLLMPSLDGFEVMRRLRASGWSEPALACSALARSADVEQARSVGFNEHLAKPVDIDALVETIASLVHRRAERDP